MKLFQIEEPDGSPTDPDAPGAAIGIDVTGRGRPRWRSRSAAMRSSSHDREGFELDLPVPAALPARRLAGAARRGAAPRRAGAGPAGDACGPRARRRRRPATGERLRAAADGAGLALLRIVPTTERVRRCRGLAAAILAEDLAPRPVGS